MAKTLIAKSISNIGIPLFVEGAGILTELRVTCVVNYGERSLDQTIDLLPLLNAAQKAATQNFYKGLKAKIEAIIL